MSDVKPWKDYPFKRDALIATDDDAFRGLAQQAMEDPSVDPYFHHTVSCGYDEKKLRPEAVLASFEAEFPGFEITENSFLTEAERDTIFGVHQGNERELTSKDQLTPENISRFHHDLMASRSTHKTYVWPRAYARWQIDLSRNSLQMDVHTTSRDFLSRTLAWFRQWVPDPEVRPKKGSPLYVVGRGQSGFKLSKIGLEGEPLIRENYNPEFLKKYDRIVKDLRAPKPSGRLAIMQGVPGTGKTYAIRAIMQEVQDVTFIIAPPALVPQLSTPDFVDLLIGLRDQKKRSLVLMIEDADEILTDRGAGNMSAISAVLNLTDGLIGGLLDMRIVATTNATKVELDRAIVRSGRLSAVAVADEIDAAQADAIYTRLTGKPSPYLDTQRPWVLADVYRQAAEDGLKPEERLAEPAAAPDEPMGFKMRTQVEQISDTIAKLVEALESGVGSVAPSELTQGSAMAGFSTADGSAGVEVRVMKVSEEGDITQFTRTVVPPEDFDFAEVEGDDDYVGDEETSGDDGEDD